MAATTTTMTTTTTTTTTTTMKMDVDGVEEEYDEEEDEYDDDDDDDDDDDEVAFVGKWFVRHPRQIDEDMLINESFALPWQPGAARALPMVMAKGYPKAGAAACPTCQLKKRCSFKKSKSYALSSGWLLSLLGACVFFFSEPFLFWF